MQHEGSILLGDKFLLDIRFSWFELRNMLSTNPIFVMRESESDRLVTSYGFVDPKYTIDQGRLPDA